MPHCHIVTDKAFPPPPPPQSPFAVNYVFSRLSIINYVFSRLSITFESIERLFELTNHTPNDRTNGEPTVYILHIRTKDQKER